MWISKREYELLIAENEKLKHQNNIIKDSIKFFTNFYGTIVEDNSENIHSSLKRLVLSGMNSLLLVIGSDKKFIIDNSYFR